MEDTPTDIPLVPDNFQKEKHLYTRTVEETPQAKTKNNMAVKESTDVKLCVAYCIDLMYNKQYPYIKLMASTSNADKAVYIAETLKRKVKNLHQLNTLETHVSTQKFTPKEPSDERFEFTVTKKSPKLTIKLMRVQPSDTKVYGYQPPLQINMVSTKDPRDYIKHILDKRREPKKKQIMGKGKSQKEVRLEDYNKAGYDRHHDEEDMPKKKEGQHHKHDEHRRDDYNDKRDSKQDSHYDRNNKERREHKGHHNYKSQAYKFGGKKEDHGYNDRKYDEEYGSRYKHKPAYGDEYNRGYRDDYKPKPYYSKPYERREDYRDRDYDRYYDGHRQAGRSYYDGGRHDRPYHAKNYDRDDDRYDNGGRRYRETPYFEKTYNGRGGYRKGFKPRYYDDDRYEQGRYEDRDYSKQQSKDEDYRGYDTDQRDGGRKTNSSYHGNKHRNQYKGYKMKGPKPQPEYVRKD